MDGDRLPKQILFGELSSGDGLSGGQKKRHKNHIKTLLKNFEIPADMLENYSTDRDDWHARCPEGAVRCEENILTRMSQRRERNHQLQNQNTITEEGHDCPICNRRCASRIGLNSHLRAHQSSTQNKRRRSRRRRTRRTNKTFQQKITS